MWRPTTVLGLAATLGVATACDGGAADDDTSGTPTLELPAVLSLPYVAAGAGATRIDVVVGNLGDAELGGPDGADLRWTIAGDPGVTIVAAPATIAAGGQATLAVAWAGAARPAIVGATLTVDSALGPRTAEVWAVAGDPALAPAVFEPVLGAGGVTIGASAVVAMPTAPYPAPGRSWTDDRVHLFVPADYRERDAHDVALHFHGHNTTLATTVAAHRYREQVYASGADVLLVVPQGPVGAASGDFGKLADPAGTAAFLDEVLTVLYRAGRITRPVLGDVTLTAHSGGYVAVAQNLAPATFAVTQVDLFDAVYGYVPTFRDFALAGGRLRSNYTATGGTDDNNRALAAALTSAGATVATAPTARAYADAAPLVYATAASHDGATRDDAAYAEPLRWRARAGRRGPRVELRTVVLRGLRLTVSWRAPTDDDVTGYAIEVSASGAAWVKVAEVDAATRQAELPLAMPGWVRVVPIVPGIAATARQPSDAYAVAADATTLIVDGFDRVVDGSWGGLSHDFAARVGVAAGAVHTVANEAITEDAFALALYARVLWLCGDESSADHTFTAAEQAALETYVAGGGRVVLSGSEIGYDLASSTSGRAWLTRTTGASFASDSADSHTVAGAGPLAGLGTIGFAGPGAPYAEEFADTFTAGAGATVVLRYDTGGAAAIALPGVGAIVGFPLELVDSPAALATLVPALFTAAQ